MPQAGGQVQHHQQAQRALLLLYQSGTSPLRNLSDIVSALLCFSLADGLRKQSAVLLCPKYPELKHRAFIVHLPSHTPANIDLTPATKKKTHQKIK